MTHALAKSLRLIAADLDGLLIERVTDGPATLDPVRFELLSLALRCRKLAHKTATEQENPEGANHHAAS